jgi:DNA polymerase-1
MNDIIPYSTGLDLHSFGGKTTALDCETTGLHWWEDVIIGVGYYCKEMDKKGYIPALDEDSRQRVYELVNSIPEDTVIIAHNVKFDFHFLRMDPRRWTVMDSAVMVHLYDSRLKKSLEFAEQYFLGSDSKREHLDYAESLSTKIRKKVWLWPTEIASRYCINDCIVTYQLAEFLWDKLGKWNLQDLFWKEMTYQRVLFDLEERGVLIDTGFVEQSADKLESHLDTMVSELYDSCGKEFNWRSPQQLSKAIYEGLGIPKPKNPFADADGVDRSRFAEAGKYKSCCTSTFILTEKIHHPLGELISSMRECDKLRKNLIKWMELRDDNDVLHTNFNQTGTRTGRLSSSKPNLQNVASATRGRFTQSVYTGSAERTEEFNMRRGIIARPGFVYLSVDYKQMEMRMFGILSQDPFMLNALIAGKDVHLEIALRVWGDCGYNINMIHREWSKTISFGLIYGMTLGSLMYKLNMTRMEASKVTDQYWGEFPRIKPWMNEIIESCKINEYLRYWSGRIWREENPIDMYKGCNALIQGGCADILSIASIRVDKWNRTAGDSFLINLVHDETINEIPENKILSYSREIGELMKIPDLMGIPFATEAKVGRTYGDLYKISSNILNDRTINYLPLSELEKPEGKVVVDITEVDDEEEDFGEEEDE